jgi:hypothetical protein
MALAASCCGRCRNSASARITGEQTLRNLLGDVGAQVPFWLEAGVEEPQLARESGA